MYGFPNFYSILLIEDLKLNAEAKYVLAQLYKFFGNKIIHEHVKNLARLIGVSDKILKKARDLLFELEYLINTSHSYNHETSYRKGHRTITFQISSKKLNVELNKISMASTPFTHQQRIDSLLRPITYQPPYPSPQFMNREKKIPLRQSGQLVPANRILLSILYLHADACGVVRGIGQAKLQLLTGMSKERLDSQLMKLTQLRYVLCKESGVTGQHLFGRATGAFFLNVFDQQFGDDSSQATLILMRQIPFIDPYKKYFWGWRLLHKNRDLFQCNQPRDEENIEVLKYWLNEIRQNLPEHKFFDHACQQENGIPMILTSFIGDNAFSWTANFRYFNFQTLFQDSKTSTLAHYLQLKINEYAATLLTQHWNNLVFDHMTLHEDLLKQITDEIYPLSLRKKTNHYLRTELIAEALGIFIYRISFETALIAKRIVEIALKDHIPPLLSKASYALLPVHDNNFSANKFAIAVKLNREPIKARYITMDITSSSQSIGIVFANSSSEVKEHLVQFGYIPKSENQNA